MAVHLREPLIALSALLALVPIAAWLVARHRLRRLRTALGLPSGGGRDVVPALLVVAFATLALAAADPIYVSERETPQRVDAELVFLFDTSLSMLARRSPNERTRIARAQSFALELSRRFPDVRIGISSYTDTALPHLLPAAGGDRALREAVLLRAVGVGRPPAASSGSLSSNLGKALAAVARHGQFSPQARTRVLVVFSDMEFDPTLAPASFPRYELRRAGIDTVFVRFLRRGERIFRGRSPDPDYGWRQPLVEGGEQLARALGAPRYEEGELAAAEGEIRRLLGEGPTLAAARDRRGLALAPYLALAASVLVVAALALRLRPVGYGHLSRRRPPAGSAVPASARARRRLLRVRAGKRRLAPRGPSSP